MDDVGPTEGPSGAELFAARLERFSDTPDDAIAYGRSLDMAGNRAEIDWLLQRVLTGRELNWRAHLVMGGLYDALGDEERASLHLKYGRWVRAAALAEQEFALQRAEARRSVNETGVDRGVNVCFVSEFMSERVAKLAFALANLGRPPDLVLPEGVAIPESYLPYFRAVRRHATIVELWTALRESSSDVYHVFASTYFNYVGAFSTLAIGERPVVIDFYDGFDPSMAPYRFEGSSELVARNHFFLKLQRFLYDQTPAICTRLMYPRVTRSRRPGVRQQRIYLPEFSWGRAPTRQKLSETDGELHVVHGGTFLTAPQIDDEFIGFLWLARRADAFKVHFHLYAHVDHGVDLSQYQDIARHSRYFHLHPGVAPAQFIDEIAAFDVGLSLLHSPNDDSLRRLNFISNPFGAWGNKFGDYLDAGLYALCGARSRTIAFILRRYGCGEALSIEQATSKAFWNDLKRRMLEHRFDLTRAREKLAIAAHGPRLVRFYEKVVATG